MSTGRRNDALAADIGNLTSDKLQKPILDRFQELIRSEIALQ